MLVNIGWAIAHMQSTIGAGKPCRRTVWPKDWSIAIQKPDANSKMTEPYIYLTSNKKLTPWMPLQADLLADDYEWAT